MRCPYWTGIFGTFSLRRTVWPLGIIPERPLKIFNNKILRITGTLLKHIIRNLGVFFLPENWSILSAALHCYDFRPCILKLFLLKKVLKRGWENLFWVQFRYQVQHMFMHLGSKDVDSGASEYFSSFPKTELMVRNEYHMWCLRH